MAPFIAQSHAITHALSLPLHLIHLAGASSAWSGAPMSLFFSPDGGEVGAHERRGRGGWG